MEPEKDVEQPDAALTEEAAALEQTEFPDDEFPEPAQDPTDLGVTK